MPSLKLIGVGTCGTNIVKEFEHYDVYELYYVDTETHKGLEGITLPNPKNVTQTHEDFDEIDLSEYDLAEEEQEVQIFVSGASDVSGCILRLLQNLKHKLCHIEIFYIKPETKFLSETQKLQHNVTYGVLQEYARSGLIDNIFIFDNAVMGQLIGKTSIANYYPSINTKIAQFVHTFNFCNRNEPIFGQRSTFLDITRIGTLGYGGIETDINLFNDLKSTQDEIIFPLEIQYYFLIPGEKIQNDENLMTEILEIVEKEEERYKSISYGVYEISGEQTEVSVLVYLRTSKIQTV